MAIAGKTMRNNLRIILADDQVIFRESLKHLLESQPDFQWQPKAVNVSS